MATINDPMDQKTIDLLNQVTNQINTNNQQILNTGYVNNIFQGVQGSNFIQGINLPKVILDEAIEITPSPNIDMEKDIYKNEFEECGSFVIGFENNQGSHGQIINGVYVPPGEKFAFIGLIDSVSEDEDDLYAKFPDGEIVPFKGHVEKFSVEIETWNDFQRSDLIGSEVRKAAVCHIMINNKLARIIEGTDIQDLLMKADRAIDELKAMPFSICRDALTLIGREIYYDNQPAIINNVDEINNYIYIIPDSNYLTNFAPPAYALEDDDSDEWITNFGQGMLVRDYDEKIWWWRNKNIEGANFDPNNDPFYKQFPQPVPPPLLPSPLLPPPLTNPVYPYPSLPTISTTITSQPWTTYNPSTSITWTNTVANNTIGVVDSNSSNTGYTYTRNYGKLNKYNKTKKRPRKLVEESPFPDQEYNANFIEDKCPHCQLSHDKHLNECTGG